jgi:predicted cupin superfamily sugar epimerase
MSESSLFIQKLNLLPHPEGGFYQESYRSEHSTGIYYLLQKGEKSSLHRIKSDEMWHFYAGDSLMVVELLEDGAVQETRLGPDRFQHVVPANRWFGAYLPEGSEFALVGCTVAPAFRFEDFELAKKDVLLASHPRARDIIQRLIS